MNQESKETNYETLADIDKFLGIANFYQSLQAVRSCLYLQTKRKDSWTGNLSVNTRNQVRQLQKNFETWQQDYQTEYEYLQAPCSEDITTLSNALNILHRCIHPGTTYFAAVYAEKFFEALHCTKNLLTYIVKNSLTEKEPRVREVFNTLPFIQTHCTAATLPLEENSIGDLAISPAIVRNSPLKTIQTLLTIFPTLQLQHINCLGEGALDVAVMHGRIDIVELILRKTPTATLPYCKLNLRQLFVPQSQGMRKQKESYLTDCFLSGTTAKTRSTIFRMIEEHCQPSEGSVSHKIGWCTPPQSQQEAASLRERKKTQSPEKKLASPTNIAGNSSSLFSTDKEPSKTFIEKTQTFISNLLSTETYTKLD